MNLAIALPPGWRSDLGSLTMLAALRQVVGGQRLYVQPPGDEPLTAEELAALGAVVESAPIDDSQTIDLLIVPIGVASAHGALAALDLAPSATALFVADLATEPKLWPDLAAQTDGLLTCEPRWSELLQCARADLPTLLVSAAALPEPSQGISASAQPYLLTWSPATTASMTIIVHAFADLAATRPELQLVVLGGANSADWRRCLRMFGMAQRSWLLGPEAYSRAQEWLAGSVAAIAPAAPAGRSVALLSSLAAALAPAFVRLAPGDTDWVSLGDAATPTVHTAAPDAARALAQTLAVLLALAPADAAVLIQQRRDVLARDAEACAARFELFVAAAMAHAARREQAAGQPATVLGDDLPGYLVELMTAALGELGVETLAPQTAVALAESLSGLTL